MSLTLPFCSGKHGLKDDKSNTNENPQLDLCYIHGIQKEKFTNVYIYLAFYVSSHNQTWYQVFFLFCFVFYFGVAWHKSACSVTAADGVNVLNEHLQVPFLNHIQALCLHPWI